MNENKQPEKPAIPGSPEKTENQWVMVLNVITGQGKDEVKRTFKLNKNRVVVGSALSSDIRIQQNSVSNVHAIIEMDNQGVVQIYDMASDTGIFVNNKKVVSEEIKDGDEIKIGFAIITFKRQSLNEAQAQLPKPMVRSSGARRLFLNEKEDFRPLILEDERNVIQIFDYPASSEQALQVVMYWDDVILDVHHFVGQGKVTIGEGKKANFLVPGMHQDFELVTNEGGAYVLHFTNEMDGVVRSGKQVITLADLRKRSPEGNFRFNLKDTDQAKIKLRGVTLFLNYSPLPPVLRRQRVLERDPFYTRIWFSSLALTAALVLIMANMEKTPPLTVDELPPRTVTMIFQPPKEVPKPIVQPKPPEPKKVEPKPEPKKAEPKPKPVPQKTKPQPKPVVHARKLPDAVKRTPTPKAQTPVNLVKGEARREAGGNQGEGARHAGTEGQAGKANAKPSNVHQTAAKGSPSATTTAKSQAQGQGNVEAFFNGIDGTISKKLAAGSAGANAAAENLRGHGGFTTEGNGGLGDIGTGGGGGGKSMSVGLGDKGLGDGAMGNGVGRIGSGGNLNGTGRGRPSIEVGNAQDTVIMGGLDKDLIDRIIKQHMDQIRHCYELEANGTKADLRGRVMVRFVIAGSGRVSQSGVENTSLQNANVERCLVSTIQRIVFPEPQGGGVVEVSYPFLFAPAFSGK